MNRPKKAPDCKSFYALWVKLNGRDQYLLWFSNEKDGIWLNEKGKILVWENADDLLDFTKKVGINLEKEKSKRHDLDKVKGFLSKKAEEIMANEVLETWNLFTDIGNSVKDQEFIAKDKGNLELYNEIFRLSGNLPATNPSTSIKALDAKYKTKLREILSMGFGLLGKYICKKALTKPVDPGVTPNQPAVSTRTR